MKEVRVGIVGFGTVGQATAQLLVANADLIEERSGVRLAVSVVCRRTPIPAEAIPAGARACASWTDVVSAPDVDIVVETIGGNGIPREVVNQALNSGKPVVTANKALIAKDGDEILALAGERRLPVGIEATTAGGIPIVRALRRSATSDQVIKLYGVLNGTVNYILSRMETEGLEFQAALEAAQQAGYAEADPRLDIDGIDARDKLCILARMAFNLRLHPEDIPVTGVRQVSQVDLQYARRLNGRIRLVGAAERQDDGIAVTVRPWLVPQNSMLGKVEGVFNAIFVEGERSGTQMFYGRGAGGPATSTAVVADLIGIAQGLASKTPGRNPMPGFGPISTLPLTTSGASCEWYLRLSVRDHPGILARVASVLAELEINIDSVLQEPHLPKERLSFVITVETVAERTIRMAIERINQFEFLTEPVLLVRMFAG
ncbi:MAG TPA: homoserine dehydrogenase [Terriglobales bacterium]